MKSLYEKNPAGWDKIAEFGHPEFREAAKLFTRNCDMDAALGYVKASSNWARNQNMPSQNSIIAVREFLQKMKGKPLGTSPTLFDNATKEPGLMQTLEPKKETKTNSILLITGQDVALKKIESIAKMLGCESVEI